MSPISLPYLNLSKTTFSQGQISATCRKNSKESFDDCKAQTLESCNMMMLLRLNPTVLSYSYCKLWTLKENSRVNQLIALLFKLTQCQ